MPHNLLEALHSGRVLLMDGAMGTELQRAGMQPGECYELWNLAHPEKVLAIHRAYVEAGAEVLLTNTFQANPAVLAKHQLENKLDAIFRGGIRLARQACGAGKYVLIDVGPSRDLKDTLCPIGEALIGAEGVLCETLTDPPPTDGVKSCPILLSFTFLHNAAGEVQTFAALTPEDVAHQATKSGIAALGVNCGREIDMDDCAEIIRRYRTVADLPLFARPNAGTPTEVDGQWVYPRSPEDMAAKLPALLEAGVTMVGGCCGTTPAHIAAFRPIVAEWNAKKATGT